MEAEKFGTDNLKKVVKFVCDVTGQLDKALADGKFTPMESFGFLDEVLEIPGAIKAVPHLKEEIADLSAEERADLHNYVAENFDIRNDAAEAFVEKAIDWVMAGVEIIELRKSLKK